MHSVPNHMRFYSATKLAQKSILEGWRSELREKGQNNIRIAAISPGLVKTEAIKAANPGGPDMSEMIYSMTPHLKTSDVTEAVLNVIKAKSYVEINDIILRHVQEK